MKSLRKHVLASVMVAGLTFGGIAVQSALADRPYPSEQEVQDARNSVTKKKAMIERIQGIIADLTVEQVDLEKTALIKAEKYNQARDEEAAIAAKVTELEKKVAAAAAEAEQAQTQLAQIASQMWRDGSAGTSLNLFLNSDKAGNLLYQLGAQEKIAQYVGVKYGEDIAN